MKNKLLILILLTPLLTYAQTVAPNGKPVNYLNSLSSPIDYVFFFELPTNGIDCFYTGGLPKRPFFVGEKGRKIKTVIVHVYPYIKSVEGFIRPNEEYCHYRFDYDESSHDKRFVYEGDLIVCDTTKRATYFYDNKGRLSLMRYTPTHGVDTPIDEVRYHYNDKGRLVRATANSMGSSNVNVQFIYEYDNNGYMVKSKELKDDGSVWHLYKFSYNDLGLIQEKGERFTYDKDKNVVKITKYNGEYYTGITDYDYDFLYYDEPFDNIEQKMIYNQYKNHFSSVDEFLTIARNNNEGTQDMARTIELYFDRCNKLYKENQQLFESRKEFDSYARKSINAVLREIELRTNIQKQNNLYAHNSHYFASREEFDTYANSGYHVIDSVIRIRKIYEQNKVYFANREEFETYASKGIKAVQERVDLIKIYENNKNYFANREEFETYANSGYYMIDSVITLGKLYEQNNVYFANREEFDTYASKGTNAVQERVDMIKIYENNKNCFANKVEFESYASKGINAVQERIRLYELYEQNKQYFKSKKDYWKEAQQGLHHIESLIAEGKRKEAEIKKFCMFVSGKANIGLPKDGSNISLSAGYQAGFCKRFGLYFEYDNVGTGQLRGGGGMLRFGEYVFWQLGGGLYDKNMNASLESSFLQTDLLFLINKNNSSNRHLTIGIGYSCIGIIEYIQSISNNNGGPDLYHNFHLNIGLMICL